MVYNYSGKLLAEGDDTESVMEGSELAGPLRRALLYKSMHTQKQT